MSSWKYFHLKVQDSSHFFGLNLSCFSPVLSVFRTLSLCGPATHAAEDRLGFLPFPLPLLNSVVCSSRTHLMSIPLCPSVSLHCLKPLSHFPLCFTQIWTPDNGVLGSAWQGGIHLLSSVSVSLHSQLSLPTALRSPRCGAGSTPASHAAVVSPSPSPLLRQCHLPAGPSDPLWPTSLAYPFQFYNIYPFYSKFKNFTGWLFACPPRFYALWRQKEVISLTTTSLLAHEVHMNAWFRCLFLLHPVAVWDEVSPLPTSPLTCPISCPASFASPGPGGSPSTGRLPLCIPHLLPTEAVPEAESHCALSEKTASLASPTGKTVTTITSPRASEDEREGAKGSWGSSNLTFPRVWSPFTSI